MTRAASRGPVTITSPRTYSSVARAHSSEISAAAQSVLAHVTKATTVLLRRHRPLPTATVGRSANASRL